MKITKVLVANRGEIAVRVIRACREQGIASVAVFSEADREALHVLMADEAYPIGPPSPAESYLAIDKLVRVAKASGADAVHPGYGFLAENAGFAEACGAAGLIFVGPPAGAIRALGDKTAARRIARQLGVPTVPGTFEPVSGHDAVRAAARAIGYPLMVKAALGERLGEGACRIAKAAGYVNAGTVEFLVDAEGRFYFLEMNTRLQVEHGVTEMVTGIDLVREQLRIAAGESLGYAQEAVALRG